WEHIYKGIKKIAKNLPYKVEEYLGKKYMNFGFDIGIDKSGKLYIFEVNDFPIVSPMKSEIAMLRSAYYKHMILKDLKSENYQETVSTKKSKSKNQSNVLKLRHEVSKLKKEIAQYKKNESKI